MAHAGQAEATDADVGSLPTEIASPIGPTVKDASPSPRALGSSPASDSALPADLLKEAARRLSVAMWVIAAVYALYAFLFATVWRSYATTVGYVTGVGSLVVSASLPILLKTCEDSQKRVFAIGMAYELVICLGLELENFWRAGSIDDFTVRVSWACLMIAFFPVLVPGSMRRIALASFSAAMMTPVAFVTVVTLRDLPWPGGPTLIAHMLPPFVAAGLSLVPARVFGRLTAHVSRARRLGSYRLIERLGAGGMGEVWRAEHELLVRPAAVKLVRQELGATPEARRALIDRFEREAQATASLESPHTVELYDFGVSDDGVFYYVMELLRGVDLETLVQRYGALPPERVAHVLAQVCESLDDAHRAGMVHRDIKPANVYLAHKAGICDFVKVLDFGLVKVEEREDVVLSRAGEIHGTPAFMAPEIATGEATVDGRSDLYSVGCLGYWLLTGKLVFDEPTSMKMALAHATREPIAPSRRGAAVPAELEALVLRCLAKQPGERPESAAALRDALVATGLPQAWTRERAVAWWSEREPEVQASAQARRSLQKGGALLAPARLKRSSFGMM